MTNAESWFNNSLRPRKPEGSFGRTAQDGHLDSHTAPDLYIYMIIVGKSMSIYNYEQYKRVINQITGRLSIYLSIYICVCVLETKKLLDFFYFFIFLFITICFRSIYKVVF